MPVFTFLKPRARPLVVATTAACTLGFATACKDSVAPATQNSMSASRIGADANFVSPIGNGKHGIEKINHVVVIYLENHSFDNLYGEFPGAQGLNTLYARLAPKQVDLTGVRYDSLPQIAGAAFPTSLRNAPFPMEDYVPATVAPHDLVHRFYQEQQQINGGRMDKFAAVSDAKGEVMAYYHSRNLPMYQVAQHFTLCDNFFHSAYGGSFLNHIWLIAAAAPTFPNAPTSIKAVLDGSGNVVTDGAVTPDNYVVNTSYTVNAPHPASAAAANLVPSQTMPTIGDRLSDKNVSWAWYSGGWNDALAGHPAATFQFHHQPFAYFAKYADGTQAKADHLKDEADFLAAAKAGTLPAVSFVKPVGVENEHPGYADLTTGENHVLDLLKAIYDSPNWKDVAVIVTYDENGGFWDHVPAPKLDRWGVGTRVPAIIVSPYAKLGHVDHSFYETSSILSFIEKRWNLQPLTSRDARANPFENAFAF